MIKKATQKDSVILAELAVKMWHNHSTEDLNAEFLEIVSSKDAVCFIKYSDNLPIGFAQCQLRRDYVEGTHSSPVGYLEGIFIKEEYRKKGYAKDLLYECELWAKEKGCVEFASDCELNNLDSFKFHISLGFSEVNRIISFRKDL